MQKESIFIQPRHIHKTWTSTVLAMFEISFRWIGKLPRFKATDFKTASDAEPTQPDASWYATGIFEFMKLMQKKDVDWKAAHKILMLGWFGFMEMRLLKEHLCCKQAIYICSLQIFPTQTLGDGFREALDIWKKPMYFMDSSWFCGTLWHDGMTSINLLLKTSRLRTNLQAAQHSELWTWQPYMHQMSNSLRRLSRIFSTDLIAAVPVARSCD